MKYVQAAELRTAPLYEGAGPNTIYAYEWNGRAYPHVEHALKIKGVWTYIGKYDVSQNDTPFKYPVAENATAKIHPRGYVVATEAEQWTDGFGSILIFLLGDTPDADGYKPGDRANA